MPQRQLCVLQFSQDLIIVTASCQGHPNVLFKKLQRVQDTAAWITLRMPKFEHTTPLLKMLHWLPIPSTIAYNIDSLCHTALTTAYPKYLSELLNVYTPAASFFLPGTHQLEQSPWWHQNCERKGHIQKASENSNIFSRMPKISTFCFIIILYYYLS